MRKKNRGGVEKQSKMRKNEKNDRKICMYPTTLNLYLHPNFDQKKRCINTMLNACGLNNYHTFCYKYIKNHP